MLFKKFKDKMICFFDVTMVTWHREVLVLHNLELEVYYKMQCLKKGFNDLTNTHNNIRNSSTNKMKEIIFFDKKIGVSELIESKMEILN